MTNTLAGTAHTGAVTAETLAAFSDAFNRHDSAALMTFMTADCIFDAAGGHEVYGTRFIGREAVQAAFEAVFNTFPDAHWGQGRHFVSGERGVSEWVFTGTHAEGWRIEAEGCDLFEFRDGLIAVKRAFRKERPRQPAKTADAAQPAQSA
jgi:ketosteroid isomerase-like protein